MAVEKQILNKGIKSSSLSQLHNDGESVLPPPSHPNFALWHTYHTTSRQRGIMVADVVSSKRNIKKALILDIGCGIGGTSLECAARGAKVVAIDTYKKYIMLLKNQERANSAPLYGGVCNAIFSSFKDGVFDCVILQDVLEHVTSQERALCEVSRVLKPNGIVYLSTPNRWSPLNMMADPHWQLPLISTFPRKWIYFVIARLLRRIPLEKKDVAALMSLKRLKSFCNKYTLKPSFVNKSIVQAAFKNPYSVFCSPVHIKLIKIIRLLKVNRIIERIVNNKWGFFNYCLNPTWYILAEKK